MNGNQNNSNYNPFDENNDYDYLYQTVTKRGRKKTYGWSLAAMICGIIGAISFISPISSIVLGVLAIVFSLVARKNLGYFDGKAVAGLILGIIAILLGAAMLLLILLSPESADFMFNLFYGSTDLPSDLEIQEPYDPQSPSV